jgi:hypothetical protein
MERMRSEMSWRSCDRPKSADRSKIKMTANCCGTCQCPSPERPSQLSWHARYSAALRPKYLLAECHASSIPYISDNVLELHRRVEGHTELCASAGSCAPVREHVLSPLIISPAACRWGRQRWGRTKVLTGDDQGQLCAYDDSTTVEGITDAERAADGGA